ncbi:MAG: hypothetical protein WCK49_02600 [Myxococcaceae bacterium]
MNVKKISLSSLIIVCLWFLMDFVFHGVMLTELYQDTAALWRPMEDMNQWIHLFVLLVNTALFVAFYQVLVVSKTLQQGFKFGMYLGLITGFGSACFYLYMPIPIELATGWFVCNLLESIVAGLVVGHFLKDSSETVVC